MLQMSLIPKRFLLLEASSARQNTVLPQTYTMYMHSDSKEYSICSI